MAGSVISLHDPARLADYTAAEELSDMSEFFLDTEFLFLELVDRSPIRMRPLLFITNAGFQAGMLAV